MDGTIFDANVYPYDGEVVRLAEDIQKGQRFPEIQKNVFEGDSKVFIELR